MPIDPSAGLNERHRRQSSILYIAVKIRRVFEMGGPDRGVGHDRSVVLERVADVAVLVTLRTHLAIVKLVFVLQILIKLIAIVLPRNTLREQRITDVRDSGRRNRKWSVGHIMIGVRIG